MACGASTHAVTSMFRSVRIGRRKVSLYDRGNLLAASRALQEVDLAVQDFRRTLERRNGSDFVLYRSALLSRFRGPLILLRILRKISDQPSKKNARGAICGGRPSVELN